MRNKRVKLIALVVASLFAEGSAMAADSFLWGGMIDLGWRFTNIDGAERNGAYGTSSTTVQPFTGPRDEAKALGFKIGTYPTGMISPAAAGMKAGLAALQAGLSEAASALPSAELRDTLGYGDYDAKAKAFIV